MKHTVIQKAAITLLSVSLIISGAALVYAKKEIIFFPTHDVSPDVLRANQNESKKISNLSNNLANNKVFAVKHHGDRVYAATLNGLSILNLKTQKFKNLTMTDGLNSNLINDIGIDAEGNIWAGTLKSISKINGDSIVNFAGLAGFEDVITYSIHTTEEGELWFSTNQGLFFYDKNKKWKTFDLERGNLLVSVINSMTTDRNGDIWAANNALFYYPFRERRGKFMNELHWQTYLPMDSSGIDITTMMTDSNNRLWIGTSSRGVFIFNIDSGDWTHLHDLSPYFIAQILEDDNKNIWIATSQGIIRIEGEIWYLINEKNNMPFTNCSSIDTFLDAIWIGCDKGMLQLENNEWTIFKESGKSKQPFQLLDQQLDLIEGEKVRQMVKQVQQVKTERAAINRSRAGTFEDLLSPGREWVADTVFPLLEKGIFEPKPSFNPEQIVTKEEALKMGLAGAGYTADDQASEYAPFCDSLKNQWYNQWLNKALEEKLIDRDRCFGIGEKMTRKEALKMLMRIFKVELKNITETELIDVNSPEDIKLIETAISLGIVKGYENVAKATITLREKYELNEVFLSSGSFGVNVTRFKEALRDLSFFQGDITNKDYDQTMIDAVATYQSSRGLYRLGDSNFGSIDRHTRWGIMNEEVGTGFVKGVAKYFDPDGYFNRAQMAVVLQKLMDLKK